MPFNAVVLRLMMGETFTESFCARYTPGPDPQGGKHCSHMRAPAHLSMPQRLASAAAEALWQSPKGYSPFVPTRPPEALIHCAVRPILQHRRWSLQFHVQDNEPSLRLCRQSSGFAELGLHSAHSDSDKLGHIDH